MAIAGMKRRELDGLAVRSDSLTGMSVEHKTVKQEPSAVNVTDSETGFTKKTTHSEAILGPKVTPIEPYVNGLTCSRTSSSYLFHIHGVSRQASSSEEKHRCSDCDCNTGSRVKFLKHKWAHTGERPFACDFCEYRCSHRGDLKKHIRIHTGERPYACTVCDYRSGQAGNLNSHMKTHTREKTYQCHLRENRFYQRKNLERHIRTHRGEK